MNRFKKIFKLILTNLIVVSIILLLLEGITRVFSTEIRTQGTDTLLIESKVYENSSGLKKEYQAEAFDRNVTVDSNRFRKQNSPFNPSAKTTLLLGDSVTMGVGVDDSETFSALIQDENPQINIANPSVIGFDTYDYKNVVAALTQKKEFNIDQVVIFFCLNDIYLRETKNTAPMLSGKPFIGQIFDFLKTNSYFYIWLKGTFFDRSKIFFENDYNLYTEKNVEGISKNLQAVSNICQQNNIQLKVVILPYEYQLRNYDTRTFFKPQEVLQKKLNDLHIKNYDISHFFYSQIQKSEEAYLFADGIHFSEKGHQIVANYVLKEIF